MAMPSGFADQLRNQLDIVEVISAYLPLKKKGREYEACCPFHQEKTPSFKVNSSKQIFHCFGCHKGGDAIRFVMEFEHLDFRGAATFLAERYGVALPKFSGPDLTTEEEKKRKVLCDVHEMAGAFFTEQLGRSKEASAYFAGRGLDPDLIEAFRLGYAPQPGQTFLVHARRHGYSDGILREAGLIKETEDGRPYDAFRKRVIFPICDPVGRVVAFGGRVLDKDVQPKYLNSPETLIYQKSRYLYAYHLAKNTIKDRGFAIITEGYMDAIACHQYGFTNAVASCGTAFTDSMARLLKRLCSRVVFLYDGDAAGQKAMYGGTQILLGHDLQVQIVALPADDDPDTLLRRDGATALAQRIARAPDHLEFFMRAAASRLDRRTLDGRVAIVEYLKELVGRTRNPIVQHDYTRRLSEFLAVPESTIAQTLFDRSARVRDAIGSETATAKEAAIDRHEIGLLRLMIEYDPARAVAQRMVTPEWLFDPVAQSWFAKLVTLADQVDLTYSAILDCAENEAEAMFLRVALMDESEPVSDFERSFQEIYCYLISRFHDRTMRDLHEQITQAEQANDLALLEDLARRKIEMARNRKSLGAARYGKWSDLTVLGRT
jgi:DNA primase